MTDDILAKFREFLRAETKSTEPDPDDFAVDLEVPTEKGPVKIAGLPWSKIPEETRRLLGLHTPAAKDKGDGDKGGEGGEEAKPGQVSPIRQYFGRQGPRKQAGAG